MHKLTFTLKQHTPLIHFQHEQKGATLRASEVKSKIDQFILKNLKYIDTDFYERHKNTIAKFFKVNIKEPKASIYKLKISGTLVNKVVCFSRPQSDIPPIIDHVKIQKIAGPNFEISHETALFANNSFVIVRKNNDQVKYVSDAECEWEKLRIGLQLKDLKLDLSSFNREVFEIVKFTLPYVFALENFGLRQSKGFGSFSIESQTEQHFHDLIKIPGFSVYEKKVTGDWKDDMREIVKTWKFLKAGNNQNPYYKSDIMKYFCMNSQERWEKRIIKKKISDNVPNVWKEIKSAGNYSNHKIAGCSTNADFPDNIQATEKYAYIRALLGLAEFYEFGMNDRRRDRTIVEVNEESGEIQRFKSPVTFKIYEHEDIKSNFIICNPIPNQLYIKNGTKRNFNFVLDAKVNGTQYHEYIEQLQIPQDFSLSDFLDSAWLGQNFELSSNWRKANVISVAGHHKYIKILPNETE